MTEKITTKWLKARHACGEAVRAFEAQDETDSLRLARKLLRSGTPQHLAWCGWLLPRLMDKLQRVEYVAYAAREVLPVWERRYPDDDRPRTAIEAMETCLRTPSAEAAVDVVHAATDAAYAAAYAVDEATWAVDEATWNAARTAEAATWAANAMVYDAANAMVYAAAYAAACAADVATEKKIYGQGIKILEAGR